MRKVSGMLMAAFFTLFFAGAALAGPSRALIQEMGSVIGKDEVNIDLDVVSQSFDVVTANDTTLGNGSATLGGTTVSSVNVSLSGISDDLELRIGRLPGFRSYLTLPATATALSVGFNPAPNNYGLTLKGAIPNVPGLAAWLGYGTVSEKAITANNDTSKGSSMRIGAAYTWAGPVILNFTAGYGTDSGETSGTGKAMGNVTTMEAAAAVLYPVRPTLLVGAELHYAQMAIGDDANIAGTQKWTVTAFAPALGARAVAGNWTIDAVVALIGTTIDVKGDPALASSVQLNSAATSTVIGVPTLRVNYKF
ncbi:MAG: hypothetical protein HZB54_07990 [Deltaproteobacteria bacterium]|nr:hypothetical protein [Deltaproteobacteria bacterium]